MKFNEWLKTKDINSERERAVADSAWYDAIRFRGMDSAPSALDEQTVLLMSAAGNIEECHQASNGEWYGCSSRINYKNAQGWMSTPTNAQLTT